MFLVIVFAAEKAKLNEFEKNIAAVLERRQIQADLANTRVKELGVLSKTVEIGKRVGRVPLLRYKWKIPLLASIDEAAVRVLKKDFADSEVEEVSLVAE